MCSSDLVAQPRRWYLVCRRERRGEPRIARFRDWLMAQIVADPAMSWNQNGAAKAAPSGSVSAEDAL